VEPVAIAAVATKADDFAYYDDLAARYRVAFFTP
jgi:hypothetical protein